MGQILIFLLLTVWFQHNIQICNGKTSNPVLKLQSLSKNTKSSKASEKELHELKVNEVLLAQSYKTGYDVNHSELAENYSTMSISSLHEKIDLAFKRVKCGYVYNAKMHLLLTNYLLDQKNDEHIRGLQNIDDILYVNEAIWMISSLMTIKKSDINELWLFYMYTNTAKRFFQSVHNPNKNMVIIRQKDVKDMHEFVLDYLEDFTDKHCESYNIFDIKSENCKIAIKLRETKKCNDFISKLAVIVDNKKELVNHIGLNVLKGLRSDFGTTFKHSDLYFQDKFLEKNTIHKLVNVFITNNSDDCDSINSHLEKIEKEAKDLSLNGVKSLGVYQRYILDLLKAIILHITWKNLLYAVKLNEIKNNKKNVHNFIMQYKIHLTSFVEFVGIRNDDFFKSLIEKFSLKNIPLNFKTKLNAIINFIKEELIIICGRLQFQIKEPFNFDTDTHSKSFNKIKKFMTENLNISYYINKYQAEKVKQMPILETIYSVEVLNGYMQYLFKDEFLFGIIHSFNKMTEDLNYKLKDQNSSQM